MDRREIIELCRRTLYTAVIADTLDTFGRRNQAVGNEIAAVRDGDALAGFVRTGLYMPIYHDDEAVDVYGEEIRLVDSLQAGDVPVLVCNSRRIAPWGELLTTRARKLGATGCITDGCIRDVRRIAAMDFPVFARGRSPVDTRYRGKMMWADVPVEFCGVAVSPGDLVVADMDGIVFVPAALVGKVVAQARAKVEAEDTMRAGLEAGEPLAALFARHGIL